MESKAETIFLKYANASLREHPEEFHEILDAFSNLDVEFEPNILPHLKRIVDHFVGIVRLGEKHDWLFVPKLMDNRPILDPYEYREAIEEYTIASREVWRYELFLELEHDYWCEYECVWRRRREILGQEFFKAPENRLMCFECDQLIFRRMLQGIVDGKEYTEIPGRGEQNYLMQLMSDSYKSFDRTIGIFAGKGNSEFKEDLREKIVFGQREWGMTRQISTSEDRDMDSRAWLHKSIGHENSFYGMIIEPIVGHSLYTPFRRFISSILVSNFMRLIGVTEDMCATASFSLFRVDNSPRSFLVYHATNFSPPGL